MTLISVALGQVSLLLACLGTSNLEQTYRHHVYLGCAGHHNAHLSCARPGVSMRVMLMADCYCSDACTPPALWNRCNGDLDP
jgi:hypothetical protein